MPNAMANLREAARVLDAYERTIIALTIKAGGTLIVDTKAAAAKQPRSEFTMKMVSGIATFRVQREN